MNQLLTSELNKHNINIKDLLEIFKESLATKTVRNSSTQSKEYLFSYMFTWLNLPQHDREESAFQIADEKHQHKRFKDTNSNHIHPMTIPCLDKLVEKVWKELKSSNISVWNFAEKVTIVYINKTFS